MDDDEEDENWNLVAPGMDLNMQGPTVSTHDGKEWVHIEDYKRVKRKLNEYAKQREWDDGSIKELNVQVSEPRERHKFSTAKRGRSSLSERCKYRKKSRSCSRTITIHLKDGTVTLRMKAQSVDT